MAAGRRDEAAGQSKRLELCRVIHSRRALAPEGALNTAAARRFRAWIMDASARLSKEAFTGNNDGTDAFTVMGLMAVVPVS